MGDSIRRIGQYQLLEPLGRGGMGMVHRAVHLGSGRMVALKTVRVQREQALAINREVGDRSGEGIQLGNLGVVRSSQGQLAEA